MHQVSFDPILAEAYRRAALEGLDMYAFAGQMERVRTAMAIEEDWYKQWDRLDDLIGEALAAAADPKPFLLVRAAFTDALDEQLAAFVLKDDAKETNDRRRWWKAFSEASFHWRPAVMQALCHAPALEQRFGKNLEPFRQFIRCFLDRRWVETRTVFHDLAADENLPDDQRGYHNYICGQIDLYFHYDYEQAKKEFDLAKTRLAGHPLALHGWIEYYLKGPEKEKDIARALSLAEEALALDPDHVPSILQKADVLMEKGQLDDAESLYRLASRKRPGNTICHSRLIDLYGKAEWFSKKEKEIEPLLKSITQLDPLTNFLTRTDVGAIYQAQGDEYRLKAENYHRQAVELFPEGIMARLNLGYFYLDITKQFDQAEAVFQQVIELAPEAREGYLAMARLHETQDQWEMAMAQYEHVRQIIPSWERFMQTAISRCLRQLNRPKESETALLRAWALDPFEDSGALNELYELAQQLYKDPDLPQPDQAVLLLEQAAQAREVPPDTAAGIANRQGHALFYAERYAEALPYYRNAASLVPAEPVYYTNQFDCLEALYRKNQDEADFEKALEALNQAASLAPRDSSIPKKRRQLALIRHNPHLADLPILYQIHVEVGQPLLGQITQDFQTLLPEMTALTDELRRRMGEKFAITLPGLRYRDINAEAGVYQFRLYETPVVYDHLAVSDANPPTMSAVLEQLEQFLSWFCLDLFVNYWDVDREVPLLPNAELVHFTRVVMALLAEQTPLPPLPELHQHYRNLDGMRMPVAIAVEKLRMLEALRPHLPGAQEHFRYVRLGEQEQRMLNAGLCGQDNTRYLALPPAYAQRMLGAVIRLSQENTGEALALVAPQDELRPYLRSILAALPQIPVLKETELPGGAEQRMLAPLVLSEQDDALFQNTLNQIQTSISPDNISTSS